jgi:hypothetical protein
VRWRRSPAYRPTGPGLTSGLPRFVQGLVAHGSYGGLPYRVSACDHLIAILELDQATVHFSARKHTARMAFAPLSVPSVDVWKGHRR